MEAFLYIRMKRYYNILGIIVLTMTMASCITARRVDYLQDMTHGSQIEIENRFEAVIAPYDELSIVVKSTDALNADLAEPFNQVGTYSNTYGYARGYLVDAYGDIEMPTLGKIHVAGLTRLRLQDTLTDMLRRGGYITSPFVTVRFNNFKIFFLGGGKGTVLNIQNERCTFLEALAMMGGLDNFTRRDHIAVMREVNGQMVMRYLDPRSSKVFDDPFFMLQQNDFIIAPSMDLQTVRSEFSYWSGMLSTIVSLASLAVSILLYQSLTEK